MSIICCCDCRFWAGIPKADVGRCRRYAPRPFAMPEYLVDEPNILAGLHFASPTTEADFWCGEAEPSDGEGDGHADA